MPIKTTNEEEWFPQMVRSMAFDKTNTTDMLELNEFDTQLVLCYGTLKYGRARHTAIHKGRFQAFAFTEDNDFSMKYTPHGKFPAVVEESFDRYQGRIYGEIWSVPTHLIPALDRIEGNGMSFNRHLVDCIVPPIGNSNDKTMHRVKDVWLYVGDYKRLSTSLGPLLHMEAQESKSLGRYYNFGREFRCAGRSHTFKVD